MEIVDRIDYTAVGKRVKAAREKVRLKQEVVAEKAGISATHLSNIERGATKPSLPALVSLANVLESSVDEFLCDSVVHSYHCFNKELARLVDNCDLYEIRIITKAVKALKEALREDAELRSRQE